MPEFLNLPTILGIILTTVGTILLLWGSHINSDKTTEKIISNSDSNKDEIIGVFIKTSQEIFENIVTDNFSGALGLFNSGNLEIKKGVILELKKGAISDIALRQKIINFLCSLNDWVTEKEEYGGVFLKPDIEWTKWKMEKEFFQLEGKVFEKEKQIISIEASNAIDEIIYEQIKKSTSKKLNFYQKNLLGLLLVDCDFIHQNIDFSGAKLFGLYFWRAKNISQTNFIYSKLYGSTLFRNVMLPKEIYEAYELGTEYNGEVRFMNVQFPQGLNLTNSYFKENVTFNNCQFQDKASFYVSTFKRDLRFFRCVFYGEAGFNGATIYGKSSFENSIFLGKTQFATVDFKEEVNFNGADFKSKPNFGKTKMDNVINLK